MTLLIAGHETTAAVLTWTFFLLSQHPDDAKRLQEEVFGHLANLMSLNLLCKDNSTVLCPLPCHQVDRVLGDRKPTIQDMRELKFTTRVINESMRLYPQPPVLIRRALQDDMLSDYVIKVPPYPASLPLPSPPSTAWSDHPLPVTAGGGRHVYLSMESPPF